MRLTVTESRMVDGSRTTDTKEGSVVREAEMAGVGPPRPFHRLLPRPPDTDLGSPL